MVFGVRTYNFSSKISTYNLTFERFIYILETFFARKTNENFNDDQTTHIVRKAMNTHP